MVLPPAPPLRIGALLLLSTLTLGLVIRSGLWLTFAPTLGLRAGRTVSRLPGLPLVLACPRALGLLIRRAGLAFLALARLPLLRWVGPRVGLSPVAPLGLGLVGWVLLGRTALVLGVA